jgi:hypothetical protein
MKVYLENLLLFNPSSTTLCKTFYWITMLILMKTQVYRSDNGFVAGYFNTTSAVNAIHF